MRRVLRLWRKIFNDRKNKEFVGNIELMDIQGDVAELGVAITAKKQNKGYGKEAVDRMVQYGFSNLGLNRIFLKLYPDNKRAVHVYEKCGFKEHNRDDEDIFMEILQ